MYFTEKDAAEMHRLQQENQKLLLQVKESDQTLNLVLKIIAQNGNALLYKNIIEETMELPQDEWTSMISNRLLCSQARNEEYMDLCRKYVKVFDDKESDFDPVRYVNYVNSVVCNMFQYDVKAESVDMLGFLMGCKGVCVHIANFFADMLALKDIPCKVWAGYVHDGKNGKSLHVYNSYIVENQMFWADPTWNLTDESHTQDDVVTKYLRMSQEECARYRQALYCIVK